MSEPCSHVNQRFQAAWHTLQPTRPLRTPPPTLQSALPPTSAPWSWRPTSMPSA